MDEFDVQSNRKTVRQTIDLFSILIKFNFF